MRKQGLLGKWKVKTPRERITEATSLISSKGWLLKELLWLEEQASLGIPINCPNDASAPGWMEEQDERLTSIARALRRLANVCDEPETKKKRSKT